jgi:hypothetical protein
MPRWRTEEEFQQFLECVLAEHTPGRTLDDVAASLGISRFALMRFQNRYFFGGGTGRSCELCGTPLPRWSTARRRYCPDRGCRQKANRLKN